MEHILWGFGHFTAGSYFSHEVGGGEKVILVHTGNPAEVDDHKIAEIARSLGYCVDSEWRERRPTVIVRGHKRGGLLPDALVMLRTLGRDVFGHH